MADLLHPDDLIRRLRLDRRRCFVITGRPGEGKSRLATQMANRYHGQRLNLLNIFAQQPQLANNIDTFIPRAAKEFLQEYAAGDLILLDEMEFLWHRWDDIEKLEFLNILKLWGKPAFFGIFLPPHSVITGFDMVDQDGLPRIYSLHDLQTIG